MLNNFIYDKEKDIWGEPQEYKSLKLYPIKVKDHEKYKLLPYLFFDKQSISDVVVLKASKLKFLASLLPQVKFPSGNSFEADMLLDFLYFIFGIDRKTFKIAIGVKNPEDDFVNQRYVIYIFNKKDNSLVNSLNENEFDDILEIIEQQNIVSSDDSQYEEHLKNPELKKALDEAIAYKRKIGKLMDSATFMEEVFSLHLETKIPLDSIKEYTFLQFRHFLIRCNIIIEYKILKPLEFSGAVTLKQGDKILHWLEHYKQPSIYDGLLIDKEKGIADIKNKLG